MKMSSILNCLSPVPFQPELTNQQEIRSSYRYWRLRIFYSIYIGYVFYYFTRKSFTYAMPVLQAEFGYSKSELGLLGTILYLSYGTSKMVSGVLSDRSNPQYFMSIGLLLTGVFNICFGLSSTIAWFALFCFLNGWFQGWGWHPCTKQLTHWYSKSERGKWWSLASTSHNVGGFLIPILIALILQQYHWRYAMYLPGMMSIGVALFLMNRLRDVPQSLGLPPIEKYRNDPADNNSYSQSAEPPTVREILRNVLSNKMVWLLALTYFFVYIVRTSVDDWGNQFLLEVRGYSLLDASKGVFYFELGGLLGILAAGWGADYFFQSRRVPLMLFCALSLLAVIPAFWFLNTHIYFLDVLFMASIGFFIFGPQMLVGLATAEFVDKKASCTATGFAGCFAYVGAAVTGFPLGKIIDTWGWNGFFVFLICSALCMTLILFIIFFATKTEMQTPAHAQKPFAKDHKIH